MHLGTFYARMHYYLVAVMTVPYCVPRKFCLVCKNIRILMDVRGRYKKSIPSTGSLFGIIRPTG